MTPEEELKKVEEELAIKEALLKSANEEIKSKIKQIEELEFELDVRQATMELLKKTWAATLTDSQTKKKQL